MVGNTLGNFVTWKIIAKAMKYFQQFILKVADSRARISKVFKMIFQMRLLLLFHFVSTSGPNFVSRRLCKKIRQNKVLETFLPFRDQMNEHQLRYFRKQLKVKQSYVQNRVKILFFATNSKFSYFYGYSCSKNEKHPKQQSQELSFKRMHSDSNK